MIHIYLQGGLGNQLFQYAYGRSQAIKKKTRLVLDTSFFSKNPQNVTNREFLLHHFNISADTIFVQEKSNLLLGLKKFFGLVKSGYWQSHEYFKDIEDTIKKEFSLKEPVHFKHDDLLKKIKSVDSISIHMRRGDYVSNQKTNKFHGVCSPEYYNAAVDMIKSKIQNPHLFIFSDDIEWCKENLKFVFPTTFVSDPETIKDYEELVIMSTCKHNIISNSSFSWWAAWLNSKPNKIVIAPKQWFLSTEENPNLIPESWNRI